MHRRLFLLGASTTASFAGCIGVDSNAGTSGGDGVDSGGPSTNTGDYAGGEAQTTATETPNYPAIDQQRAAIRNTLNSRRQDESASALEVNGENAALLRELTQRHAQRMAERRQVDMELGGTSLIEEVDSQYGTCQVRVDGSIHEGGELIFLGRVGPENAIEPQEAADAFLEEWLGNLDTRGVLLSIDARTLGLGLSYGGDGLYVAMIMC